MICRIYRRRTSYIDGSEALCRCIGKIYSIKIENILDYFGAAVRTGGSKSPGIIIQRIGHDPLRVQLDKICRTEPICSSARRTEAVYQDRRLEDRVRTQKQIRKLSMRIMQTG